MVNNNKSFWRQYHIKWLKTFISLSKQKSHHQESSSISVHFGQKSLQHRQLVPSVANRFPFPQIDDLSRGLYVRQRSVNGMRLATYEETLSTRCGVMNWDNLKISDALAASIDLRKIIWILLTLLQLDLESRNWDEWRQIWWCQFVGLAGGECGDFNIQMMNNVLYPQTLFLRAEFIKFFFSFSFLFLFFSWIDWTETQINLEMDFRKKIIILKLLFFNYILNKI